MPQVNNIKQLRNGYTTGTCAAAATHAALHVLLTGTALSHVCITVPSGKTLTLEVVDTIYKEDYAECSIIKDAGDDPDITNGIKIVSRVTLSQNKSIELVGGIGVGMVTKPGLSIPPGQYAINPVPRQMISNEAQKLLSGSNKGCHIEISAPEGVEIAKRTFNPKLGIIGGISILGTSGEVIPMSEEALKDSLALELSILAAQNKQTAILLPGNYAEAFIKENYSLPEELFVSTSNFLGFMFHQAVKYNFKDVLLVGHIGKLVKLAGGIFHTHSRVADARNEILAAHCMHYTKDVQLFHKVMNSNTTEEAVTYIDNPDFFQYLVDLIKERAEDHVHNELNIEVILYSMQKGLLGQTAKSKDFINHHTINQG